MKLLPDFLIRLGLDTNADEAAIESAYARELKKIDPSHGPQSLQDLRAARAAALQWIRTSNLLAPEQETRATRQTSVPTLDIAAETVMQSSPPAPLPVTQVEQAALGQAQEGEQAVDESAQEADAAARAVFYQFSLRFSEQRAREPRYSAAQLQAELAASLADPRLEPALARRRFERLLVEQLAAGWKPGHELLFAAAVEGFQWEANRNKLAAFGEQGEAMVQALNEWQVLQSKAAAGHRSETALLVKLRTLKTPSESDVAYYLPLLREMMERYAHLLPAVTDMNNVRNWLAAPAVAAPSLDDLRPSVDKDAGRWKKAMGGVSFTVALVIMTVRAFMHGTFGSFSAPPPTVPHHRPPPSHYDPSEPLVSTDPPLTAPAYSPSYSPSYAPRPTPAARPASHVNLESLMAPIRHKIMFNPKSEPALYPDGRAAYLVELDEAGNISNLSITHSSGMSRFDEAVARGVRAAAPFRGDANGNRPPMFSYSISPAELMER